MEQATTVEKIANAVLYEGYMLYPYRASSVKNRQRFNWGALAPKEYSDAQNGTEAFEMQTECLITGCEDTEIRVRVRFLHLTNRAIGKVARPTDEIPKTFEFVDLLDIDGELYQSWQEAVERIIDIPPLRPDDSSATTAFSFADSRDVEPIERRDAKIAGVIVRTREQIDGLIDAAIEPTAKQGLFKLTVTIKNTTPFENAMRESRDGALLRSLVSTHAIMTVEHGEFVSLLEPAEDVAAEAAACTNRGAFPILVGTPGDRRCMLASPIILYDYPEIAPESAGDLFDSTEIDEILTLRIMTMTDQEKREMRAVDDRARKILERTETMSKDELLRMHGTLRGMERSRHANG